MFENLSASYDVGIAKKYGINCAVLLNKLIYLSKYTSRKDGYCWRTSKELEDELGLSRYQQDVAIKKLTEENIIETKNTYIIGTQIKCKHFKLLLDISKCDLQETNKSIDCRETNICDLQETNKSVNNNNTSNNNTSINNKEIYKESFNKLWNMYPNKKGKTEAFKKFEKAIKDGVSVETIEDGIQRYITYIETENIKPQFIKHGSTWFNQRCWEDDYTPKVDDEYENYWKEKLNEEN